MQDQSGDLKTLSFSQQAQTHGLTSGPTRWLSGQSDHA